MTGGAAGLAGVSGPATPSLTPVPPTTDLDPRTKMAAQFEAKLLTYLLRDYDRRVRPVTNHNSNVTVHVGITLTQIFDMVRLLFLYYYPLYQSLLLTGSMAE